MAVKNLVAKKALAVFLTVLMVGSVFGAVNWAPTVQAASSTITYYLHNIGTDYEEFMSEENFEGENDGRGYNQLGSVFTDAAFVGDVFGVPHVLGDVVDEYPASPVASGFALDSTKDVEATIYVCSQDYNNLLLNISLYDDNGFLGGASVENVVTIAGSTGSPELFGYVPFEAKFKILVEEFNGNLKLVVRPEIGTGSWMYGYDGDHASFVKIPVQSTVSPPLTASFDYAVNGNTISADASGSIAGSGTITNYKWQWKADGMWEDNGATPTASHSYDAAGTYQITLEVKDGSGATDTETKTVSVGASGQSPTCTITSPSNGATVSGTVTISGTAADGSTGQQGDFNNDGIVIIAIVDSGINFFHDDFRASTYKNDAVKSRTNNFQDNPSEYIDEFPDDATAINVDWSKTTYDALKADFMANNAIQTGKLYWIPGTKVIGAYTDGTDGGTILDTDSASLGHGTHCASVAAGNIFGYCPDALIVAVQGYAGIQWACQQPWIDFVSNSWGTRGNIGTPTFGMGLDLLGDTESTKPAVERGQIVLFAAGNGVENGFLVTESTYTSGNTGPDWLVTVGAAALETNQTIIGTGKPVDITSYGSGDIKAADYLSTSGVGSHSGTSCATPMTAGVFATALLAARNALEDNHVGQYSDGQIIAQGTAAPTGPLSDGKLTREELKEAVFKTALPPGSDYISVPVTMPLGGTPADWPLCGYGIANKYSAQDAVKVVLGQSSMPDRSDVDMWMEYDEQVRDIIWGDYDSNGDGEVGPVGWSTSNGARIGLPAELQGMSKEFSANNPDYVFNAYLSSRTMVTEGAEGSHFIEDPEVDSPALLALSEGDIIWADVGIEGANMIFDIKVYGFTVPVSPVLNEAIQYEIYIDGHNFEVDVFLQSPQIYDNTNGAASEGSASLDLTNGIIHVSIPLSEISEMSDGSAAIYLESKLGHYMTGGQYAVDRAPDGGTRTYASAPENAPPTCTMVASPNMGNAPLAVSFTMSASDTDGTIASWDLDFGDAAEHAAGTGNPSSASHTYSAAGTYAAVLTVTDDKGATGTAQAQIVAGTMPEKYVQVSTDGGATWNLATGTASWNFQWDTVLVDDGQYTIRAKYYDGAAWSPEDSITVSVQNGQASEPPACAITSPASGAQLKGTESVAGTASPGTGAAIQGVQVKIDDGIWNLASNTGTAFSTWSYAWDTTTAADGAHTIYARAYNGTEYSASANLDVTVNNSHGQENLANKWALLVGMCDYPPIGAGGSDLEDCYMDVASARKVLTASGFAGERIRILENQSATVNAVKEGLQWLADSADADSEVFFYYSGHGESIGIDSAIDVFDGAVWTTDMEPILSGLQSKKAFFGFDACQNGAMDGVGTGPLHVTEGLAAPGRIIVSASSEATLSYSTGSGGAFTRAFIEEGLLGGAGDSFLQGNNDGKTSIEEAFNYAFYRCETAGTSPTAPEMLPQMNDQYDGEMFFEQMGAVPEPKPTLYFHTAPLAEGVPAGSLNVGGQL
ncbi:MAG: PKD domain-containing protein, partial [Candidatus Thermoplasmatota archaeon]|nr:PKD domain-containing protein [Candidatus Thermoplasmatota archaeon]